MIDGTFAGWNDLFLKYVSRSSVGEVNTAILQFRDDDISAGVISTCQFVRYCVLLVDRVCCIITIERKDGKYSV